MTKFIFTFMLLLLVHPQISFAIGMMEYPGQLLQRFEEEAEEQRKLNQAITLSKYYQRLYDTNYKLPALSSNEIKKAIETEKIEPDKGLKLFNITLKTRAVEDAFRKELHALGNTVLPHIPEIIERKIRRYYD